MNVRCSVMRGMVAITAAVSFFLWNAEDAISQNAVIPIAIKKVEGGGSAGPVATKVLQAALVKSGFFKTVGNPAGVPSAEAVLSGEGKMEATLLGRDGTKLFKRTYERGNFELDALQFADDIALTLTKRPGIATSQITFVVNRRGRREIFVCDYDGRNARSIVSGTETNVAPAISPDGKSLVFSGLNRGLGHLMRFDLPSQKMEKLVEEPILFAQSAWSPDGKSLAVAMASAGNGSGGNSDLHLIRFRGRQSPKVILETPVPESRPVWSPDGKQLLYTAKVGSHQTGLFTLNPAQVKPSPRAFPTGFANTSSPDWSPDGEKVAFVSTDSRGRKSVCLMYPKGNGKPRRLASGFDPVWGANSRHLVYSTGSELRILDSVTGKAGILVRGIGPISEPSWTR